MICKSCREAGAALQQNDLELAAQKHSVCELAQVAMGNETRCDCHHLIKQGMINQERSQKDA